MTKPITTIVNLVWSEIAEEIGGTLPLLIQEKVQDVLGADADDAVLEATCKEVAGVMGPLAYD